MIYAYGICEPATAVPPPAFPGLGGATLRALEDDGLAAVYSRHRSLRPRAAPALVLTHERVIEAIMARGPVLPLRFGTQLDREESLCAALAERRTEMLRGLGYVRGRVELGLRVIPAARTESGRQEQTGRDYLMDRVRKHRQAELAVHEIHEPLRSLATDSVERDPPAPPAVLVAAYLVPETELDSFRNRAADLATRHGDLEIHLTGPWPPYSFVDRATPR